MSSMPAPTFPCASTNAQMVEAFQHLYNHHRPHGALAGKTPAEYLAARRANETPQLPRAFGNLSASKKVERLLS